jgi:hypothetical protein
MVADRSQHRTTPDRIRAIVREAVHSVAVVDIHTHLFDPAQGELLLSGIDALLTYHYHVAELLRVRPDLAPEAFFALPTARQADLVWDELFVRRCPLSEVGRGIVTALRSLGLDPNAADLTSAREFFASRDRTELVDDCFRLAGVRRVYMTNDPLDETERATWLRGFERDPRFLATLRLDSAIMGWPRPVTALAELGYGVDHSLSSRTLAEVRRYLRDWGHRLAARYMAVSLPPTVEYPYGDAPWLTLLTRAVLPVVAELGIPLALMIGVRRQANPRLGLAGDSVGATDVESIENLARDFQSVRFLVTVLARESQHALCVAARKFANLTPFGCWWFMSNEGLAKEITAMRLDLLGTSFVPQHSDARVLEQLVSKWRRSRQWLGEVLAHHWADLAASGFAVDALAVRRDVTALFGGGPLAEPGQ